MVWSGRVQAAWLQAVLFLDGAAAYARRRHRIALGTLRHVSGGITSLSVSGMGRYTGVARESGKPGARKPRPRVPTGGASDDAAREGISLEERCGTLWRASARSPCAWSASRTDA